MASDSGKENIADGLVAYPSLGKVPELSPRKSSRKTRSKSIGPGGLDAFEEPALKESSGNRRKSAFIPAVKSILASNDEDEKKRRRKSLARRRVSFAPEATLHTWDVVEYVRDATTSSASSEGSRRASAASENAQPDQPTVGFADSHESPSTPPPNADEPQDEPSSSPANQRDLHQKKHRRSSGIPPMNFNNPDDIYSSSPLSGDDAQTPAHTEAPGLQLDGHDDENDEDDDVSMEIAEDEITTSFKPWAKTFTLDTTDDQEKRDPFSAATPPGASDAQDDNEDVSMDITRAIGAIVQQSESPASDLEDISMDLTLPLGNIKAVNPQAQANRRKSLKRRASLFETSQGSPAKRPAGRRTSLRKRAAEEKEEEVEDATMDFTVAIGSIKSGATMERQQVPSRRQSVETSFADETMEFTVAIGSIKDQGVSEQTQHSDPVDDEDMSMEFTRVVGGIKNLNKVMGASETAALTKDSSPATTKPPTPRKSPARVRASSSTAATGSRSPPKMDRSTPRKSPGRPHGVLLATPIIPPPSEQIEKFEPSPFVRHAPQALSQPEETISTPTRKPLQALPAETSEDPIAAPILNRRRSSLSSVQFSPLAPPREEPVFKSTASLSDNIKLLSTPRKQTLMSPMKRGLTPKKSQTPQQSTTPRRQTPTPKKDTPRKSLSPIKRVAFGEETPVQYDEKPEADEGLRDEVERISLQEFLDMTRIRFMDLSTTKRRHTAAPSSFHDKEVEEKEDSLDRYVVAAACTLPEYELYQHACHEMKKYISDGRHFVRTMEANVMEENPLLFTEYLTAPPDQRAVMDNQFKNLKTSARLDARGEWYTWRSTLLRDLKAGLLGTMDGFLRDELALAEKEKLLDSVLPPLVEQHEQLENQCKQLQQRHDELNSCDREELEQTREQLVAADAEMAEKRQLIAQLQSELSEKEARIEAAKERKVECAAEIKAAERVREECRGWSVSEVNDLKQRVASLEQAHGWSIATASSAAITMTHVNDLELYFHPSAFGTGGNTPNASISLTYVGDAATPHPRPLTTSKRFFLQLIRAHLHCLPQSQTRVAELLALVKNAWAVALAVAEGVRWLEHNFITDEFILSDERMAISANMLLPSLQTKVKCTFEISVAIGADGVEANVEPMAELVYGEKYKVDKMRDFLGDFCGTKVKAHGDMAVWADGVLDLAQRLKATGRKGERT